MLGAGLFVLGFLTGIFGGLSGIGGGPLLVPFLVSLFHVPIQVAVGASLISVLGNSVSSTATYLRLGLVNIRLAIFLEIFTVIGALIGSVLGTRANERLLTALFVVLLLGLGLRMIRKIRPVAVPASADGKELDLGLLGGTFQDSYTRRRVDYRVHNIPGGLLASVFAGGISGMLGIGGGVVKVPLMATIMRIPMRAAAATSAYMIGITATASLSVYFTAGYFNPLVAVPVAVGGILGAQLGSRLQGKVPGAFLRWLFVGLMFYLAAQMAYRAVGMS